MNDPAGSQRSPAARSRARRPVTATAALSAALALTAVPATAAAAPSAAAPSAARETAAHRGARFAASGSQLTLTEPATQATPGYAIVIHNDPFGITTTRGGAVVLATTSAADAAAPPVQFTVAGTAYRATSVLSSSWNGSALTLDLATTDAGHDVTYTITPSAGRYTYTWSVRGMPGTLDSAGVDYALSPSGHWYGQGEAMTPDGGPYTRQPWPLDSGQVTDDEMGPSSYLMTDPFWFTESSAGFYVHTGNVMHVAINQGDDGIGSFAVTQTPSYEATVFVGSTPRAVYQDYIGVTGTPASSNAAPYQYREPLWNDWGQMYTSVSEQKILAYARGLAANHIPGHAIQIDDGWMSAYGDFTFNSKFPTPKAMSAEIRGLGFNLGLWVTLWIDTNAKNFSYAKDHGYFLMSAADPSQVCLVPWWDGPQGAGIVDLANPAARAWFAGQLENLEKTYGINGFKFDTRFFDPSCRPDPGYTANDYLKLGAEFTRQFNQQGAGVRISWTGSQKYGFVTREIDKSTGWSSLQAALDQDLAISTIGYPFVETDGIGGSDSGPPPSKQVLIRWAQAAALTPLMYSFTSPADGRYDAQTISLYRAAARRHERLTPYILEQVKRAVASGEPIMKPVFFDFPRDRPGYTIADEWLLGDSLLAAPIVSSAGSRTVDIPPGRWFDVEHHRVVTGPAALTGYQAGLAQTPVFIRLGTRQTGMLMSALAPGHAASWRAHAGWLAHGHAPGA
jgi:alpha-glucosidase (family GH31 glycosyl hydrolase)